MSDLMNSYQIKVICIPDDGSISVLLYNTGNINKHFLSPDTIAKRFAIT